MALQDYIEEEGNLELQKKRQDETNERKNAVEAYVYMLRNQLSDALSQYVTEQEQSSISSKLTDTEVVVLLCTEKAAMCGGLQPGQLACLGDGSISSKQLADTKVRVLPGYCRGCVRWMGSPKPYRGSN